MEHALSLGCRHVSRKGREKGENKERRKTKDKGTSLGGCM
jgi:hypothetical protein